MKLAWLAVVCACSSGSSSAPPSDAAKVAPPKAPPPKVSLVRCAPAVALPAPVDENFDDNSIDDTDVYGGLLGDEPGEMQGGFGYGRSGFGPGGGSGIGTIGTGRYGTIGHGSGTGDGYGVGTGRGHMRSRDWEPEDRFGDLTVTGPLDKAIVHRYLARNKSKIDYCYEKALLASPGLGGTLTTRFTIDGSGKVLTAEASGVSDEVSSCVKGVVQLIEFPKPKGGAAVAVVFPAKMTAPAGDEKRTPEAPPPPDPWTPFLLGGYPVSATHLRELESAVIGQLGAMSACFGDGAPTGSFRAMVSVNDEGKLSARVGGLGDHASEACVAQALAASSVAAPDTYPVEAACDLQRGDAQPWRVDATSGYDVYELTSKEIVHGTEHTSLPFGKGVSLPARDPSQIALVIAAPDTTADAMSSGLGAIKGARPALVAIRQESGAVVLVGAVPEYSFGGSSSPSVTLAIKDGRYKACVAHVASQPALGDAALADRAGLATLLRNAFAGCAGSQPCDPSLVFSITTPIGASDWLALAGAAHDAGFSTIATGGVTCSP